MMFWGGRRGHIAEGDTFNLTSAKRHRSKDWLEKKHYHMITVSISTRTRTLIPCGLPFSLPCCSKVADIVCLWWNLLGRLQFFLHLAVSCSWALLTTLPFWDAPWHCTPCPYSVSYSLPVWHPPSRLISSHRRSVRFCREPLFSLYILTIPLVLTL